MDRRTRRITGIVAALGALALLVGCSATGDPASQRTWVRQQNQPVPQVQPELPGDNSGATPGPSPGGLPQGPSGSTQRQDPSVVATHLKVPWGLAMLPDGSALVGERSTGRIVQVQPKRSPVRQVKRLTGIQALLGLAVSPAYDEDNLVFAYVTTRTDNRILRFTLDGTPTPIFTGIPRGRTDNGGRIGFGPDGDLYVGTGDAGRPTLARQPDSLAGKILRLTVFGSPARDNPDPGSPVYSSGFTDVTGLCWNQAGTMFATDLGGAVDRVVTVPADTRHDRRHSPQPTVSWKAGTTGPGGCAVIGFGLFVGALEGHAVVGIPLDARDNPGRVQNLLHDQYGRLRTVVAAPDGALWVTTSNRDGHGHPIPADDRVLRINPPTSITTSPV